MGPWLLIVCAFFSSALAAVLGLGGGVLLISLMPGLIPNAAVVPVHGVVQWASNLSRAALAWREITWKPLGSFTLGAAIGAAVGSRWVVVLPDGWLPVLLGLFILFVTWAPWLRSIRWPGRFVTVGGVQTFVSLFVGAAGPLISPLLLREGFGRDRIVATHGAMMSVLHGLKTATFVVLGFEFLAYGPLMAGMIVAATLGSWAGTRLRGRLSEKRFRKAFKVLLTLLALRLVLPALLG